MYLILKKGILRDILSKAFARAGSIRSLASTLGIPRSTLFNYYSNETPISIDNLRKLTDYLNMSIDKEGIIKELCNNWKQIKGGKKCVEIKKKRGDYKEQLKQCQKEGSKSMKLWHKEMKRDNPEKYYLIQYEKFKKVAGYKFLTNNNERVRNNFEKEIANLLKKMGLNYKYEPLINIGNRYFFPDFLVNNDIIIECTFWRGSDKAIKLKDKMEYLKKRYEVYVLIPKALKRYYEILNHHLLLGTDDLVKLFKKSG